MLRRFFYISAILILAFTITAVGQDKKRVLSKAAKVKQAKKGVSEWTDILARKNNKQKAKTKPIKPSNYTAGGTWVSGDPLTFNLRRKKTTSRKK